MYILNKKINNEIGNLIIREETVQQVIIIQITIKTKRKLF